MSFVIGLVAKAVLGQPRVSSIARREDTHTMNLQRLLPWAKKPKRVVIGHLPVEAGCVLLLDPCWLRDKLFRGNQEVEDWYESAVVGQIGRAEDEHWPVTAPQAGLESASLSLGHLVISGNGDGCYPVEATYLPDGTVSELRIVFQPLGK